jgi:O-antigen biosynthesis protein
MRDKDAPIVALDGGTSASLPSLARPRSNPLMLPTNLPSRSFQPKRINQGFNNWLGHLPFARDLIGSVRPATLVELGTHYGESYFGFCQSVVEGGVPCTCYAVDTWKGDEHAGFYGEEVFTEVKEYNDKHYAGFSNLLRMTFDQALPRFEDSCLDMLHIDGLHTYDAIAHDVNAWFPKLRPGGVLLLHDVEVRRNGFQVWRLWEELQANFPTFTFRHHSGLGVLRKPWTSQDCEDLLTDLLQAGQAEQEEVRRYYVACAKWLVRSAEEATRCRTLQELLAEKERLFTDADTRLREKTSQAAHYTNLLGEMEQKSLDANTRLNEKTSEAQHLRNLLGEMEQKFLDASTRLNEKTSEAQHLRNLLGEMEPNLLGARSRLKEQEQHYENLLAEKTLEANGLRDQVREMENSLSKMENSLLEMEDSRSEMENSLSEMENSLSWRWTAPVRRLLRARGGSSQPPTPARHQPPRGSPPGNHGTE